MKKTVRFLKLIILIFLVAILGVFLYQKFFGSCGNYYNGPINPDECGGWEQKINYTKSNNDYQTSQNNSFDVIYPLYPNVKWGKEVATDNLIFSDAKGSGYVIRSESISDSIYFSFKESFEEYYDKRLIASGWVQNSNWVAGGPNGNITGYSKGDKIIIISYDSKEVVVNKNSIFSCPCNVTLSIFFGTLN